MKKRRIRWILGLVLMLVGAYVFGSQISVEKNRDKYSQVTILSLDKQIEAVCQDYQKVLSQTDLQKLEQTLLEQTGALKAAGWSERSIAGAYLLFLEPQQDVEELFAYLDEQFQSSQVFGSPLFQDLWNLETDNLDRKRARELLEYSLELTQFPQELSGRPEETAQLLAHFDGELEPDAYFWASFSRVVQKAFPKNQLAQKSDLAKRVHQFRYLISAQQAQWVRDHFRKKGQTDREALVAYLASKHNISEAKDEFGLVDFHYFVDYDLEESSRLHNKAASLRGQSGSVVMLYPDFEPLVNIKIVMSFHTEFILASNGRFANELDPEGLDENGLVNGASFNYANKNNKLHRSLDVQPVGPHDPAYRKEALSAEVFRFQAPNNQRFSFQAAQLDDWLQSHFNSQGIFSIKGQSAYERIRQEIESLKKDIKEAAHV